MKILVFVVFVFVFNNSAFSSTDPLMVIETSFSPSSTVLSESEKYLVIGDDSHYQLWNLEEERKILEGDYTTKVRNWLSGATINEGSGFLLIEDQNLFLTIEYRMNDAHFKAFDIRDGSKIWENRELKLGISWFRNLLPLLQSASQNREIDISIVGSNTDQNSSNRIISAHAGMVSNDPAIGRLIHYVEELDALVVNGHQGLQKVALSDGQLSWIQEGITSVIGEVLYVAASGNLVVFSVHSSEISGLVSRPEIYHIHSDDGSIIWTEQYIGNYRPESSYILGDNVLVTDFFGLVVLDLTTGKKIDNEINESYSRAEDALRVLTRFQSDEPIETITTKPLFNDQQEFYYVVGTHRGHSHPMTGNKVLQKVDPIKGGFVYQAEDIGGNQETPVLKNLHDQILYIKMARRNQTFIHGVNAETGEILFTTDRIRNRHDTDFDPFYVLGSTIVDLSSTGIFFYDRMSGNQIGEVSFNDLDIGRLNTYFTYEDGFVIVGGRGIAFTDVNGNLKHSERIGEILSFNETNDRLYLRGQREMKILDKSNFNEINSLAYQDNEFIVKGDMGIYWLYIQGRTIKVFSM